MRWLQFSDFHYNEESAKQNYLEEAIAQRDRPDFIVVTGDLHTYPQKRKRNKFKLLPTSETNTYSQVYTFLHYLLEHWELTKDDIFIVPGNHDVDVNVRHKELKPLSNGTAAPPRYIIGQKSFFEINEIHLSQRFSKYAEFIKDFFGEDHEASRDSAGVFIRTWKNKMNILHTNTALYSTANNSEEPHFLDTYALSKLKLSNDQKKLPTLLLGHHNFFRLEQYIQDDVKTALENLNVVAYLCGDKHIPNHDKIDVGEPGRSIALITCMASAIDKSFWSEVGMLEYIWDESTNFVNVIELQWNSHRNILSEKFLCRFNMNFDNISSQTSCLRREVREQIENLNPNLLPSIKDEVEGIIYENKLLQSHSQSMKTSQFPLVDIFLSKKHQNGKQLYLFEGTRSTRGGTGKTSSLLSAYRADELCREFQPVYIQLRSLYHGTLVDQVEYQVGPRNGRKFLLLLDGFDEIASERMHYRNTKLE